MRLQVKSCSLLLRDSVQSQALMSHDNRMSRFIIRTSILAMVSRGGLRCRFTTTSSHPAAIRPLTPATNSSRCFWSTGFRSSLPYTRISELCRVNSHPSASGHGWTRYRGASLEEATLLHIYTVCRMPRNRLGDSGPRIHNVRSTDVRLCLRVRAR
ncbi:hypothetical protein PLICRDRAFT_621040 [Plicaturopsis crispa FD-325 SS-3]|nr:hypothetical protein PLICRDRAFT_621040 [Plicaturopsis crispa FD-325 SS-3]